MKNKKGFTLVELLAVIVILGVLLLIAVPGIQTVISNSKKKTFKSNVSLVANSVNSLKLVSDSKNCLFYFDGDATSSNTGYVSVERGSLAGISGIIEVDASGNVKLLYAVDTTNGFSIGENKVEVTAPTGSATGYSYNLNGYSGILTTSIVDASVSDYTGTKYNGPANYDKVKCDF